MKLSELPKSVTVSVCTHVLLGKRKARHVSFQNGLNITCSEPDHGIYGEKFSGSTSLGELERILPWLREFPIETGQVMELGDNDTWSVAPKYRGPREMNEIERDEYYKTRKELSEVDEKVVPIK